MDHYPEKCFSFDPDNLQGTRQLGVWLVLDDMLTVSVLSVL